MIKTILIFGRNGMLGNYMYSYFKQRTKYNVIGVTRKEFEITETSLDRLEPFLLRNKISNDMCIINCIGAIPQRNTDGNMNYLLLNTVFPLLLSRYVTKYGARLIHPTTDCVFNGLGEGMYDEEAMHDESGIYGTSKSLGEPGNATVIRTSIIGEELYNKKSFLEWVKNSRGDINGWTNHSWNGITCLEYCKVVEEIIRSNLFWRGVKHVFSPSAKSKYELACIIKRVYDCDNLNIIPQDDIKSNNKTLGSVFKPFISISELEDQIAELKDFKLLEN